MTLQRLELLLNSMDTGLKAATILQLTPNEVISASDIAKSFLERGFYGQYEKEREKPDLRNKIEGIKTALDEFHKIGIVEKYDTGEMRFQTPRHTYKLIPGNDVQIMQDIARNTSQAILKFKKPYQFFWHLKGGSYSSEIKHLKNAMLLCGFYGADTNKLENANTINQILESHAYVLTSEEFAKKMLVEGDYKSHITYLVNAKLINKSQGAAHPENKIPIRKKTNVAGKYTASNARVYFPTHLGEAIVKQLFIPAMSDVLGIQNSENDRIRKLFENQERAEQYIANMVQIHYASLLNQNTLPLQTNSIENPIIEYLAQFKTQLI